MGNRDTILLKEIVVRLDDQLANNTDLVKQKRLLVKEVRLLKEELEKRVVIHPSLRIINQNLFYDESEISEVRSSNMVLNDDNDRLKKSITHTKMILKILLMFIFAIVSYIVFGQ